MESPGTSKNEFKAMKLVFIKCVHDIKIASYNGVSSIER